MLHRLLPDLTLASIALDFIGNYNSIGISKFWCTATFITGLIEPTSVRNAPVELAAVVGWLTRYHFQLFSAFHQFQAIRQLLQLQLSEIGIRYCFTVLVTKGFFNVIHKDICKNNVKKWKLLFFVSLKDGVQFESHTNRFDHQNIRVEVSST